MNFIYYPDKDSVINAVSEDSPLLVLVSFDGKTAVAGVADESAPHYILLIKTGFRDTDIDKFFRIVLDRTGADWTFVCPPDYKGISDRKKRIGEFYKDGFRIISDTLHEMGMLIGINIPKRYRRHLDALGE